MGNASCIRSTDKFYSSNGTPLNGTHTVSQGRFDFEGISAKAAKAKLRRFQFTVTPAFSTQRPGPDRRPAGAP